MYTLELGSLHQQGNLEQLQQEHLQAEQEYLQAERERERERDYKKALLDHRRITAASIIGLGLVMGYSATSFADTLSDLNQLHISPEPIYIYSKPNSCSRHTRYCISIFAPRGISRSSSD